MGGRESRILSPKFSHGWIYYLTLIRKSAESNSLPCKPGLFLGQLVEMMLAMYYVLAHEYESQTKTSRTKSRMRKLVSIFSVNSYLHSLFHSLNISGYLESLRENPPNSARLSSIFGLIVLTHAKINFVISLNTCV